MSGLKFLITLLVIYFIFRSVMKKVLGAVNPEEGGGGFRGKLGEIINQMKEEVERATQEMAQETAMEEEDPWADLDSPDEEAASYEYEEEMLEEDVAFSSGDRWDEERVDVSLWDDKSEEAVSSERVREMPQEVLLKPKKKGRSMRGQRLREAVVWKEILDRPVGLR